MDCYISLENRPLATGPSYWDSEQDTLRLTAELFHDQGRAAFLKYMLLLFRESVASMKGIASTEYSISLQGLSRDLTALQGLQSVSTSYRAFFSNVLYAYSSARTSWGKD